MNHLLLSVMLPSHNHLLLSVNCIRTIFYSMSSKIASGCRAYPSRLFELKQYAEADRQFVHAEYKRLCHKFITACCLNYTAVGIEFLLGLTAVGRIGCCKEWLYRITWLFQTNGSSVSAQTAVQLISF